MLNKPLEKFYNLDKGFQDFPPLKPKDPRKKKLNKDFGTFDIESNNWIDHVVTGCFHESIGFKHFESHKDFFEFIFSKESRVKTWIAHNGSKFDFRFLLEEVSKNSKFVLEKAIPRGTGFLMFDVVELRVGEIKKESKKKKIYIRINDYFAYYEKRRISFVDSIGLLAFSLKKICKDFQVEHAKGEWDHSIEKKICPELLEYLEKDCRGLYEAIKKFYSWEKIEQAGPAVTIASQAQKVLSLYLPKEIPSLPYNHDNFVRAGYFGGRTETFKMIYEGNEPLSYFDVNSLYPFCMTQEMPGGFRYSSTDFENSEMGYFYCDVFVPEMYIPPLAVKFKQKGTKKLLFPHGYLRGVYSTIELRYAISLGAKILKIHKGIELTNEGPIFKDFILDMYNTRRTFKNGSVQNTMAKLIMNSSYGRLGINRERVSIEYFQSQKSCIEEYYLMSKDNVKIYGAYKTFVSNMFSNVAIAAWITSLARTHMHKQYMKNEQAMFYTDTDSLITSQHYDNNASDLGALKLEKQGKRFISTGPKFYMFESEKNGEIKKEVATKGIPKALANKLEWIDFKDHIEKKRAISVEIPEKIDSVKASLNNHNSFLSIRKAYPHIQKMNYDKRRVIPNTPYLDTVPFYLDKDGNLS